MPLSKNNLILQPTNVLAPSVGAGLKFDGINDLVRIDNSPELTFLGQWTVTMFVRFNGFNDNLSGLFSKSSTSGYGGLTLYARGSTGDNQLIFVTGLDYYSIATVPTFTIGQIYQITFVNNGLSKSVYLDSVFYPTVLQYNTGNANNGNFAGELDVVWRLLSPQYKASKAYYDLKIFNKVLTQSEIDVLFLEKGSIVPATALANLVANYTFNQKSGTSLFDTQGNNGTLINFAITNPGVNNAWVDDLQNSILI